MKIFGQVTDTNREPMLLANITIVTGVNANNMGTSSDLDGNFVLENDTISPDSEFKISYIGYTPQFRKASELQGEKIKLADDVEIIEDVDLKSISTRPNASNIPAVIKSSKQKFVQHLQDHKFVYASIGGLAGIILIVRALRK